MYLVQNFIYFLTFLFGLTTYLNRSDACFHESFKDAKSSKISTRCEENINARPWEFKTFNNMNIRAPTSQTSNGLITSLGHGLFCLAGDFSLQAVNDSQLFVTYFATGTVDLTITLSDLADDENVVDLETPIVYDIWTTYEFTLMEGGFQFIIVGIIEEYSKIIIDSVTYVDPTTKFEYCVGKI